MLDRLAYMGRRGMGTLEFRPARGLEGESRSSLMQAEINCGVTGIPERF